MGVPISTIKHSSYRRKAPGVTLWKAGGGGVPVVYGFGWWTGPDGDLLCIRDKITCASRAEKLLSPMRESILLAFVGFVSLWIKGERS